MTTIGIMILAFVAAGLIRDHFETRERHHQEMLDKIEKVENQEY